MWSGSEKNENRARDESDQSATHQHSPNAISSINFELEDGQIGRARWGAGRGLY
jgi:hypothetical protein